MDIKICLTCKKEFSRPYRLSLGQWDIRKYCSQNCVIRVGSTGKKYLYKARPKAVGRTVWNKGKKIGDKIRKKKLWLSANCLECNKVFYSYPASNKKYCSPSCRSKFVRKRDGTWNEGKEVHKIRGENHYNWKGGKGSDRKKLMQQRDYIVWRKSIFKRDNYTCQHCNIKGGYLEAHHIKSWANNPDLRYTISNGITLCKNCHTKTDSYAKRFLPKKLRKIA